MIEPDNHTAWVDRLGDTWVRTDDMPGEGGVWWPLCDGPGWEPRARNGVGEPRGWSEAREYGPFEPAGPKRATRALERVRAEVAR